MMAMAEPRAARAAMERTTTGNRAPKRRAPDGVGMVAALWLACCLLLAAGRTADLGATAIGGVALGWLLLPLVVVGLRPIRPGEWLVGASVIWAVVQTVVGAALTMASETNSLSTTTPIANGLAAVPLVLVPSWIIAGTRSWRRRRPPSPRLSPARSSVSGPGAVVLIVLLAGALGIAVTLIGSATWSDEAHVFASLSATLTSGLGFTWWIATRGRPDQRMWLASGFLLLAFVAVDCAVGPLGPFGIAFQTFAWFWLVNGLASRRDVGVVHSVRLLPAPA